MIHDARGWPASAAIPVALVVPVSRQTFLFGHGGAARQDECRGDAYAESGKSVQFMPIESTLLHLHDGAAQHSGVAHVQVAHFVAARFIGWRRCASSRLVCFRRATSIWIIFAAVASSALSSCRSYSWAWRVIQTYWQRVFYWKWIAPPCRHPGATGPACLLGMRF